MLLEQLIYVFLDVFEHANAVLSIFLRNNNIMSKNYFRYILLEARRRNQVGNARKLLKRFFSDKYFLTCG